MQTNQFNDEELVENFIDGDHKSFEILVERYQKKIYSHIYLLVKNQDLTEDLFQDSCIKVIRTLRLGQYNEEGRFYPWFKRVAHNLTLDHLRKAKQTKHQSHVLKYNEDMDIFDYIESEDPNIQEEMIRDQAYNELMELVDQLPIEQKEVVILRHFHHWSFQEIAEEKNISINTALGRMRYALKHIRRIIVEKQIDLAYAN